MHGVLKDLRFALRSLVRAPGFTIAAVLALGLGIGSATAIYSLLDGVVLQPLPYREPERLVSLWDVNQGDGKNHEQLSPVTFLDYRRLTNVFEDAAAWWRPELTLTDEGTSEPIRISAVEASANFFSVLGVAPHIGQSFTFDSALFAPQPQLVISHRLWQSRFGGDPKVVGKLVRLDGAPTTIVGVMPAGFGFPGDTDAWDRLDWNLANHSRGAHFMESIARLRPGVTVDQVNGELGALTARLGEENKATNGGWTARGVLLDREVTGIFRPALFALFGAAGLLLVIACINVANLHLARATARQREVAIRAAIGASRGRLVRQLLTESLVLGVLGALVGLAIAIGSVKGLLAWSPVDIPRAGEVGVDTAVLLFATALALLTSLGFGLAPAILISRAELHDALKESTKSASSGSRGQRMRNTLVVAEVALAVMLLSGAGLLIRSVEQMLREDTGVDATQTLTANIQLPQASYGDWARVDAFFSTLMDRVREHPQISEAGTSNFLPLDPAWRIPFQVVGRPTAREDAPLAQYQTVDKGYFAALRVPLVRGRWLTDDDIATTTPVVMINEAAAKQYFGDENPVGKRITAFGRTIGPLGRRVTVPDEHEIVGVVQDIRNASLKDVAEPALFFSQGQFPFRKMHLVVRGRAATADLLGILREEVRKLDPTVPVANVKTMDRVLATSVDPPRLVMLLMMVFAALALTLAAVGIYGILSYTVSSRQKEMSIRLALGARPGQVLAMIMREGLLLVAAGCIVGVIGALVGGQALGGLLYEVRPTDPLTTAVVVLGVIGVAVVACVIPGRRAARVDAVGVLRGE